MHAHIHTYLLTCMYMWVCASKDVVSFSMGNLELEKERPRRCPPLVSIFSFYLCKNMHIVPILYTKLLVFNPHNLIALEHEDGAVFRVLENNIL